MPLKRLCYGYTHVFKTGANQIIYLKTAHFSFNVWDDVSLALMRIFIHHRGSINSKHTHTNNTETRNSLDCDQSNYSSRIFSDIPFEFGQTGISAIRMIHSRDIAIWIFQDGGRAAIFDLAKPKIAPFDPPTPKTPPKNQTWSGSDDPSRRYGHLNFPKCEVVGRSSVGPQYIIYFFLHWSHILFFATLGT